MSLPSWERGLKFERGHGCVRCDRVAPLVGAWIEIMKETKDTLKSQVAPLVGAWIEIVHAFCHCAITLVAPLVGARIEIYPIV